MNKNHQVIINNIGNTYKNYINISLNEDMDTINLKLDKFANIELKLKNTTKDIDESLQESVNELSTSSFIQIKDVPNGYLISSFIGSKKGNRKITAFCEDIDFNIEFYDYSQIKISEDENIDNYRVRLGVKQARNLLSKHALLGDENLNDIEKNLLKYAMLIVILNSAQDDEKYDMESICSIYDLFLKYDNKYEKIEFLEQALKATELYTDKIQEINEIKKIIEDYIAIQHELDKNTKNTKNFNFEEFQNKIKKYQEKCYYYKPLYKVYADFTLEVKKACKDFKNPTENLKTDYSISIRNYIDSQVIPVLKQSGFEGEYPYFTYKSYKKLYTLGFEINSNKTLVKYDDRKINSKKIVNLLENIEPKDINVEDVGVYLVDKCSDIADIARSVNEFLDELKTQKIAEYGQTQKENKNQDSSMSKKENKINNLGSNKSNEDANKSSFIMQDRDYIKLKKMWYDEEDELLNMYNIQAEFFEHGQHALGAIVAANEKLYKWGILDLPAFIVYSLDEYYNDVENMQELVNIAYQVGELSGRRQEDNNLKQIVYALETEVDRAFGIKLPYDMTNGRDVFFTSVMIPRKYLPKKKIDRAVYPFNILVGRRPDAMLVPHWYW